MDKVRIKNSSIIKLMSLYLNVVITIKCFLKPSFKNELNQYIAKSDSNKKEMILIAAQRVGYIWYISAILTLMICFYIAFTFSVILAPFFIFNLFLLLPILSNYIFEELTSEIVYLKGITENTKTSVEIEKKF